MEPPINPPVTRPTALRPIFAETVAVCLAVAVSASLALRTQPLRAEVEVPQQGLSQSEQTKLEQVASASLFGQFRSNMSDFLWVKVDKYLHNGIDLRGTTKIEAEAGRNSDVRSAAGEAEKGYQEHASETTVIPSRQVDWRGFYGDLEREVLPYADMSNHTHRDPKEALPLFRLMTAANPHFIAGYVTGSAMIAREPSRYPEALAFLQEGVKNNPYSVEILQAIGAFYTAKLHQFEPGRIHLEKAIAAGGARDRQTMTEDEVTAYLNAFRWLVLNRREAQRPDEARAAAIAGLKVFPDDKLCQQYQYYPGISNQ